MKKLLLSLLFVFACASLATANLLTNASFETEGAGGSWDPAGWSRSDGNDRTDISGWGGGWAAQDGSNVMRLHNHVADTPGDHFLGQELLTSFEVGETFEFSIWAFCNNSPVFTDAYVSMGMKGGSGPDVWQDIYFTSALSAQTWGDGWVQHTFAVTNVAAGAFSELGAWVNVKGVDIDDGDTTDMLFDSASITTSVPEPISATLLVLGFAGLYAIRRRRS